MAEKHPSREALTQWLAKIDAQFQWCEAIEGFGLLRLYRVDGMPFLLHSMETNGTDFGWEIYVPAHNGNETLKTMEAVEKYLGLKKE